MGHHVRQCVLTGRCCSLCVVRTIKPLRIVTVFCHQVMKHRPDRYKANKRTLRVLCRIGTAQKLRYISAELCDLELPQHSLTPESARLLPNYFHVVRFEVFTAVTRKNAVFWDVTTCGSCKNRRFSCYSEDVSTKFLRNIGSYKKHTM
jgi:hypothetical protein